MAVNQNDVLQIVDYQTYLGVEILNVYYYRYFLVTPAVDPVYDTVKDEFVDTVITAVRAIQITTLVHTSLEIRNLTNGVDIHAYPLGLAGTGAIGSGVQTPSFLTAGFILRRETGATRNGYKRFSGLDEQWIEGNTLTVPATPKANLEAALAAQLQLGLIDAFDPVIYREANPSLGTPAVINGIGSAQFVRVGTQNTRKN